VNQISKLALVGLAVSLAACSIIETEKVNYRTTTKAPSLDVPPDMTQLSKDSRYAIVGGAVSASSLNKGQPVGAGNPVAVNTVGDIRVERAGNQRWLVVNRAPEKLWEPLKDFWMENGLSLAVSESTLGIMETEWNENRAKLPNDIVRSAISKIFDSVYSTPERDKYRTRLERDANGNTEIFISHRGLMEIYTTEAKDTTMWQPRPADPELEAEFLQRLMVKLGSNKEQAKAAVTSSVAKASAVAVTLEGSQSVVRMEETFDRAWRRVGLALDRSGFTVEDRDRKQGIYFVRYVPVGADAPKPGFFASLFSGADKTNEALKYQIAVRTTGTSTVVSVLDGKGNASANSETAQRIIKVIADDLK
jgi:outer membrane protein assembly factor BamC